MADGFKLEIVSPERLMISELATAVTIPGVEGYFTVMSEHSPLLSVLKPGFVSATDMTGKTHEFYVRGGFADVSPEGVTILAEDARPAAEFDRAEVDALIVAAQQDLDAAATPEAKSAAQMRLDSWRNLLFDAARPGAAAH